MILNGNSIQMTRGDSECLIVSCKNPDGSTHPLVAGDTITLTIRKTVTSSVKGLQKDVTVFNEGKAYIAINPTDTSSLDFGRYVYDIQITKADGTVKTIITPSLFEILSEVSYDAE